MRPYETQERYPFYPMFPHWKHLDRSYFLVENPGLIQALWACFHGPPSTSVQDISSLPDSCKTSNELFALGSLAGSLRIADGLVMCWCFSGGWSIWSHQSDQHLPLIISWFHMSWKLTTLLLLHVSLDPSDQRALESSLRWSSILGIPRVKRPGQSVWPGATWIVLLSPSLRFSLLQHVVKTSMWLQFSLRFPWNSTVKPVTLCASCESPWQSSNALLRQRNPVA